MGSRGDEPELETKDDLHVLVTGFGPFRDNAVNPSYLIAQSLPSNLPWPLSNIHIHAHPTAIKVSYDTVLSTVPSLLFTSSKSDESNAAPVGKPNFDIVVHIGMANPRKWYGLERQAHRDGYDFEDVDGVTRKGDKFWRKEYGSPEVLTTGFEADDVWRRWKAGLMDEDIRPSDDAGHYLCDFIYYTSLVEYWRRYPSGDRPVVFLHVPGDAEAEDIERGRRITLALIRALVESRMAKEKGDLFNLDIQLKYKEA